MDFYNYPTQTFKYNGQKINTVPLDEIENQKLIENYMSNKGTSSEDIDLQNALRALSDHENQLLYYKYWEGLTIREIANKLKKPKSTIQYGMKLILKKLQKILE